MSQSAKNLLASMMDRNIKKRLSIENVLNHGWFDALLESKQNSVMGEEE